jgi:hypothetical protein
VVASETIDIPLCGSDALLRACSRIAGYHVDEPDADHRSDVDGTESEDEDENENEKLQFMSGSLQSLSDRASPMGRRIITGLAERLNLRLDDDVSDVFEQYAGARRDYRTARRGAASGFGRRGRGAFGRRREVRESILDRWPELEDSSKWSQSDVLKGDAAKAFVEEVQAMPSYEAYARSRDQREASRRAIFDAEMKQVRFQRLIHTLESVVLAENLKVVAAPEIIERYEAMLKLEQSSFR